MSKSQPVYHSLFQISTCLPFAIPNLYLSTIRYSKSQLVYHSLFQISTCLPFAIPNLYLSAIPYSKSQLVNHSLFQISTCLLFQSSSCLLFNICTCPLFLISMHPPCLLTFPDLHVPILSVNVAIQTVHTDLTAQNGNKHLRRRRWGDILSILMSSAHNGLSA